MWPDFVVVSTPILHLRTCVVKTHEPVCVQALRAEFAVERFDEAIIRRLAWPREVEDDAPLIGPQIEIARDELRALIDTDALGEADDLADPFQRLHDVLALVAVPRINSWRKPRIGVNNCQHTDLTAG